MAAMSAQAATPFDLDAFLALARLYVAERQQSFAFDEEQARWTFAGSGRLDPAIILLRDDADVIGFAFVRMVQMPFTKSRAMDASTLFVRADKRCPETEAALIKAIHDAIPQSSSEEACFSISSGDNADYHIERLASLGYAFDGAYLRLKGTNEAPRSDVAQSERPESRSPQRSFFGARKRPRYFI